MTMADWIRISSGMKCLTFKEASRSNYLKAKMSCLSCVFIINENRHSYFLILETFNGVFLLQFTNKSTQNKLDHFSFSNYYLTQPKENKTRNKKKYLTSQRIKSA